MARKQRPSALAQPPWTYAPSEVMEWLSSGPVRGPRRRVDRPRPIKEVVVRCPPAVGRRAVRRFDMLPAGRPPAGRLGTALAEWARAHTGVYSGVTVRLTVRSGADGVTVRLRFHPSLPPRRALRLVTRLGLEGRDVIVL